MTRAAAIDFGAVRIGLAVADELGMLAHPRPHLDGRALAPSLEALAELAATEGIGLFLVGLPLQLDGREGKAAHRARRFAEILARRTGLPVELIDERLSTRQASERLRAAGVSAREQRGRIDSAAAAVLLQAWLDGRRGEP